MTMMFRTAKAALQALLAGYASTGGYRVMGYKADALDASDLSGARRLVQVYASEGDFPKGNSAFNGPSRHEPVYAIELMTSKAAEVDLTVLENESATAVELAAAIAASQEATALADDDLDEFIDVVFNLLMDNRNMNLDMDTASYRITDRWIPKWKKSAPMQRGQLVTIHARLDFTCRMVEEFLGLTPVSAEEGAVKTELQIATDEDGEPGEALAASQAGG